MKLMNCNKSNTMLHEDIIFEKKKSNLFLCEIETFLLLGVDLKSYYTK